MVLFNSSTWLLIVVFVNVVSAANINETKESVKTSFISLLKNIVNINEKRTDAMKHIDEEKVFRLDSYLSKTHKKNDYSQEYEANQNPYISIIDMRRNLNFALRETYTQPRPVIEDENKMFLPFETFTFRTLKVNNKKNILQSDDQMIEQLINKRSKDSCAKINNIIFIKDKDIIEQPKQYLGKFSIDNIITKLFGSDNSFKKKKTIFEKEDNTIKLPSKYLRRPSIRDLIIKFIELNDSYQKKRDKLHQKEDISRKLQDIINILKKTYTVKNQNGNVQKKVVNHNCDDETEEETKFEVHKKKNNNCCNFNGKQINCGENDANKKKPNNVALVFILKFDDGKKGEESKWTDWSYKFDESSSWENKGNLQNTRKSSRKSCDMSAAAKSCRRVCSLVHEDICTRYKCIRQAKQAFRKECKRTCTAAFVASKDSEELL